MKEFKTDAFAGFEKSIRDARVTRSAIIGELLGNALAEGWFSVKRQADRLSIAIIATKQAALNGRLAAHQHLNDQNHAVTPH